ncbi:cupin domain-containing protein [Halopelagius longus]|uniref:Cupin domain-containing protein n=1 Tax=Halopelagius longus TaxID=1236180 RepID=A0A1H0Y6C5_9EURY|nr:cupin domain-containing protein [Halopelagius longus]RDI72301.1 cupin domain-containing protein [Halopelagius longus]SDQ10672.1 Cupin domain-containing protein [Halopelagius longus]
MVSTGDVIENPATGERIAFRTTAEDSGGRAVEFDYYLEPGGFAVGKFDHVHPRQEERIDVRSGELGVRIDGDEWTATPGTQFSVLPETEHTVWNAGDREMHAVVELRPGLKIEAFFETMFGLAQDGKTDRRGIPSPLQSAVLADEYREEIRPPVVPGPAVNALASVLAPVGRRKGYRARYPRYADRTATDR